MEEEEQGSVPKQFVIKSMKRYKRYLRYIHEVNEIHGFLQFSGKQLVSQYTKFEVENSKTGKGLVHIRCCFNNKYWVLKSRSSHYIVAAAKEAEEDPSKYSCTLFKPIYDHHHGAFRFRHVSLDRNVHFHYLAYPPYLDCLFVKSARPLKDESDLLTLINWNSFFILPKRIAFKGNNDLYLTTYDYHGKSYLQFSASDVADPKVANEVFMMPDGHVCIKNYSSGKFWVHDPDWILADSTKIRKYNPHMLFKPVKLDNNNAVALRCLGNDMFCKRLSYDGKDSCLNAAIDYVSDEVRMEITEPVLSREIYNVDFRLSDCRIYGETPLVMASGVVENGNTVPEKLNMKLAYEDTMTTTWTSSIETKLGVKLTIKSGVPKIAERVMEISAEMSEEYKWGGTQQTKNLIEVGHEVVVPASSKVKAKIVATQGICDIPFSYTQRDKLMDGTIVIRRLNDGVYTGVNCYDYQFLTEQL